MKHHDSIAEAAKAAPPLTVGGITLLGFPLEQWVLVGTFIYTIFLLIDKAPVVFHRLKSFYNWIKNGRNRQKAR